MMWLNRRSFAALSAVLAAVAMWGLISEGTTWAQERPSTAAGGSAQGRRVPPFFGQIGITPEQREQIYAIRGDYDAKISALLRQLEELKGAEMSACESVLTPAQKQLLDQLRTARGYRPPVAPAPANAAAPPLNNVKVEDPAPKENNPPREEPPKEAAPQEDNPPN